LFVVESGHMPRAHTTKRNSLFTWYAIHAKKDLNTRSEDVLHTKKDFKRKSAESNCNSSKAYGSLVQTGKGTKGTKPNKAHLLRTGKGTKPKVRLNCFSDFNNDIKQLQETYVLRCRSETETWLA